jgi:hypothetical protein
VEPDRKMVSPEFNRYLEKLSARFEERLFMPDPRISERGERIKRMMT